VGRVLIETFQSVNTLFSTFGRAETRNLKVGISSFLSDTCFSLWRRGRRGHQRWAGYMGDPFGCQQLKMTNLTSFVLNLRAVILPLGSVYSTRARDRHLGYGLTCFKGSPPCGKRDQVRRGYRQRGFRSGLAPGYRTMRRSLLPLPWPSFAAMCSHHGAHGAGELTCADARVLLLARARA
jgi:hypothetical protein